MGTTHQEERERCVLFLLYFWLSWWRPTPSPRSRNSETTSRRRPLRSPLPPPLRSLMTTSVRVLAVVPPSLLPRVLSPCPQDPTGPVTMRRTRMSLVRVLAVVPPSFPPRVLSLLPPDPTALVTTRKMRNKLTDNQGNWDECHEPSFTTAITASLT